ncbi:MAG: hypothetical protein ABI024_10755 [Vicinamibacterales bacterium]
MSGLSSSSGTVPIAHTALRILIVLNWVMGAAILALLVGLPNEQWIMSAFQLSPSPDTARLVLGLRAIAAIGLAVIPLNYAVLERLLAIVATVRNGDPFVGANASRLQALAWAVTLPLLSLVIGAIAKAIRRRRIRSTSMPAFRSTAGSPFRVGLTLANLSILKTGKARAIRFSLLSARGPWSLRKRRVPVVRDVARGDAWSG